MLLSDWLSGEKAGTLTLLKSLSVTKTLLVLALSGFLVVLAFAGPQVGSLLDNHRNLQADANLTQLARSIGSLTHELQKERGASAGFVSSKGMSFADVLPRQRASSDGAIADFLETSGQARSSLSSASVLRGKIDDVRARVSELAALRRQVDSLSIETLEAVGQITALNRAAIGLLPELGKEIGYADAARAVQRQAILMTAKDIAGLERATGATAFALAASADGVVPMAVIERFRALVLEQDVLFDVYNEIASSELKNALADFGASESVATVQNLRNILISGVPSDVSAISSEVWFDEITKKMGTLKQIEDLGTQELISETEQALALSRAEIVNTISLLAVLVFVVGFLTVFLARRILKAVRAVTDRISGLAAGDIDAEIPDVAPSDLRRITEALAVFRGAELERRAHSERQSQLEMSSAAGIERVSKKVADGDFSARLRLRDLQGASSVLGEGLNEILAVAEQTVTSQMERDRLALEQQTAIAEAGQQAIAELREIVRACTQGDFSQRLRTDDKDGVFAELCDGVNRIGEVAEAGLSEVTRMLDALSRGDLTVRSSGQHEGIFLEICRKLDDTVSSLTEVVAQISDGVGNVQASSAELAASADDLATRTERNAAALVETSAAIEELTASVSSTAEGARQIGATAKKTEQETEAAAKASVRMVAAIESIAGSSDEISKITSVIDDISFQTNLLALNAGVEAARAGDAGRGFAVVASEVRTLAQRAAEAAKEINQLISHSQTQVAEGVEIVNNSRSALEGIQTSVGAMTREFLTMVEASSEQSSGISEINRAVVEMEHTTQENAAMFEETSAVVMAMRDEAEALSKTVSRFSVDGTPTVSTDRGAGERLRAS